MVEQPGMEPKALGSTSQTSSSCFPCLQPGAVTSVVVLCGAQFGVDLCCVLLGE